MDELKEDVPVTEMIRTAPPPPRPCVRAVAPGPEAVSSRASAAASRSPDQTLPAAAAA